MSTYFVTFRIASEVVGGKSYDQRYDAMIEALRSQNAGFWAGTTSFLLVESTLDTETFTKRACASLSSTKDMLIAFDPSDQSCCRFGAVTEPDILESFLPQIRKV